MDGSVRTVDLANRVLAYREYGDPSGEPVLFQHSLPSSSLEAAFLDAPARDQGVRLIAIDRPGMGGSSMSPNRSITEMVRDVGVLINRLGIAQLSVLANGGGAPYAWVLGQGMPHRIRALGILAGDVPGEHYLIETAKAFMALGTLPFVGQRFRDPDRAERAWTEAFKDAGPADKAVSEDPDFRANQLAAIANAFVEGSGGPAKDTALIHGAHWGFDLSAVAAPALVWHGSEDHRVSVEDCRRVADQVPGAEVTILDGEGHASVFARHGAAALEALAARVRTA